MSWSAGCRAGWAGGSLADAIRLAGQVAAVERFAMIVGWRRASAYDPATERIRVCVPLAGAQALIRRTRTNQSLRATNQSLRAPCGRAGSDSTNASDWVQRIRVCVPLAGAQALIRRTTNQSLRAP